MSETHVVINKWNGKLERYPSLAKAKAMCMDRNEIYTSYKDLVERLHNSVLIQMLHKYSDDKVHRKLKDSEAIAKRLWPLLLRHAEIKNPWAPKPTPGTKSFEKAYTQIQVSTLYAEYKRDRWQKALPPQAETLMDYFVDNIPEDGVTEQQLEVLVRQCHSDGYLKTRQDPFRIYQYYRAELFRRGFLTTMFERADHAKASMVSNVKS